MNPLLSAFAQWAEALANGTLALDPAARARLEQLDGRSIQIETPLDDPVSIEFTGTRIRVMARSVERPNAIVRGSLTSLLAAGVGRTPEDLRIDGDESLVEEFRVLLTDLRPDLSEPLGHLVGEQGADTLVGFLEVGGRALQRLAEGLREEGSRAISEGAQRQFLDAETLNGFSEQVFDAQLALDRLNARVTLLEDARDPGDSTA